MQQALNVDELMRLIDLLPERFKESLLQQRHLHDLVEVILDQGRQPVARFPQSYVALSDDKVSEEDIEAAVSKLSENGFGDDNRAGIDRTLHRISCLRNRDGKIFGLTMRVGRAIPGSANLAADVVRAGCSILLLGRPGVGKSTSLRDCARILAEECRRRVIIVDTSNEIGGDGDIPHPSIASARRMQVPHTAEQHRVMIEAVENHMPEVLVIDEIGTAEEANAARTIAQRGVQLIATAHGSKLENLIKNPTLSGLLGGIESVTLGDEEARRRGVQKSILERAGPPTFDVAVEMVDRTHWRVHRDVAAAVDRLLLNQEAGDELRTFDAAGKVVVVPEAEDDLPSSSQPAAERPWSLPRASQRQPAQQQPAQQPQRPWPLPPDALVSTAASTSSLAGSSMSSSGSFGSAPAMPAPDALHLFAYGIDEASVTAAIESVRLGESLWLTERIHDADAILALRSKVKQGDWVRTVAKQEGIPVYAIKSAGRANLVRALRTLLGLEPSAGALFSGPQSDDSRQQRADTSVVSRVVAENTAEALEEARLAVEEIVLTRQQATELLPRTPAVIEQQVALVAGQYGLGVEVAGTEPNLRLRILPANMRIAGG